MEYLQVNKSLRIFVIELIVCALSTTQKLTFRNKKVNGKKGRMAKIFCSRNDSSDLQKGDICDET